MFHFWLNVTHEWLGGFQHRLCSCFAIVETFRNRVLFFCVRLGKSSIPGFVLARGFDFSIVVFFCEVVWDFPGCYVWIRRFIHAFAWDYEILIEILHHFVFAIDWIRRWRFRLVLHKVSVFLYGIINLILQLYIWRSRFPFACGFKIFQGFRDFVLWFPVYSYVGDPMNYRVPCTLSYRFDFEMVCLSRHHTHRQHNFAGARSAPDINFSTSPCTPRVVISHLLLHSDLDCDSRWHSYHWRVVSTGHMTDCFRKHFFFYKIHWEGSSQKTTIAYISDDDKRVDTEWVLVVTCDLLE